MLQRMNTGALGADGRVREDAPKQWVLHMKVKCWGAGGTRGMEKSSPDRRNSIDKALNQGEMYSARY